LQSHPKPACAVVVQAWEVLVPVCHIPYLRKKDARNLKDCHIRRSSNVKSRGAQRMRETAKPPLFLKLIKVVFDCGTSTQPSAGVAHH
jgi:hypothetical protein